VSVIRETKSRHAVKRDGLIVKCCWFVWGERGFRDC